MCYSFINCGHIAQYTLLLLYMKIQHVTAFYLHLPFAGILPLDSPSSGICDAIDIDEQYLGSTHTHAYSHKCVLDNMHSQLAAAT